MAQIASQSFEACPQVNNTTCAVFSANLPVIVTDDECPTGMLPCSLHQEEELARPSVFRNGATLASELSDFPLENIKSNYKPLCSRECALTDLHTVIALSLWTDFCRNI